MSELKDAWMALESHWKITPKDARITGDASYGFMRWTLAPLFRIVGITEIVSTLLTIVGQP